MSKSTVDRLLSVLLLGFIFVLPVDIFAEQPEQNQFYSLLHRTVDLVADGTTGPFQLPDRFLLPQGEKVWVDGRLFTQHQDYQLDYNRGLITFTEPPPSAAVIRVQYKRFPFSLKERYFHREPMPQQGSASSLISPPPTAPTSPQAFIPSTLRVGGSKTFAISLGSERDLSLEQSLRVNITGQVSPEVEVVALLSDQSSPLQPEGDTQTLEEIDKVLVEIRGRRASATLGDYQISYLEGEFGRFDRKLQGAKGTIEFPMAQATVAGAVSRGTFRVMSFSGIEGKQGPYQLTDDQGGSDIIVLAGTERVWIDGQRMTRGQNNDYIIEYGSGQITFTMHRLITADSRIAVDYEYSAQKYKRSFYGGHGQINLLDRKLQLRTMFIRESDDGDSPMEVALSRQDRSILREAGDDPSMAWKDGWVLADTSEGQKGDYVWVDSTYFVYVGPDSNGIYNVAFSDVGSGNGDYVRQFSLEDNRYYYVYQGDGDRRYLPRIYLPLPSSQSMADFQAELKPSSHLQLRAELGLSHRDENILSRIEDDDNVGRGISLDGRVVDQPLKIGTRGLGRLDLMGRYRSTNDRFRPPGRTEEVEYYRRWDLDRERQPDSEEVQEISGTYRPLSSAEVSAEYGQLSRGDFFSSTRRRVSGEVAPRGLPRLTAHYGVVESERSSPEFDVSGLKRTRWIRQGLSADKTIWRLKPLFSWEGESREAREMDRLTSGERYDQFRGGLSAVGLGAVAVSTEMTYRQDHAYQGKWLKKSLGRTLKNRVGIENWRALTMLAEYTRRTLRFQELAGTDSEVDLIQTKVSYAPLQGAVQAQVDYQVSNAQSSQKRRIPVDVGQGKGDYRLEDGEYIPDSDGNWIFRIVTEGDSIPVTDLAAGLRLRLTPHRAIDEKAAGVMGLMRNLSTDTFVRIDEQTTEKDKMSIYLLKLHKFQQDSTTIRGEISFQQDLFLFPDRRDVGIRLRYQTTDRENNQYVSGGEENLRITRSIRVDLAPRNRQMLRLEYGHENKFRKVEGVSKSRIRADNYSAEGTFRPQSSLELSLGGQLRGDRDAVGQTKSRMVSLEPKISYSFLVHGRLRTEFEWAHVSAEPEGMAISWEMAQGNRVGDNYRWSLSVDYRVNQYVSSTVSYSLRSQPGRPTRHLGRAEMRAFF
jgi:hypothetical protein